MVGFVIAMENEIKDLLNNKLLNFKLEIHNNQKFYKGNINNKYFIITFSGIGKVNAAKSTMNLISNYDIDNVINIGSACGIKSFLKHFDIVIGHELKYYDVDVTAFGYKLNQVPKMPESYLTNKKLTKSIVNVFKQYEYDNFYGTIVSGDSFVNQINKNNYLVLNENSVLSLDMESTAIAQVCYSSDIKFACLKIISDNLTHTTSNENQFDNNLKIIAKMIDQFIVDLIKVI